MANIQQSLFPKLYPYQNGKFILTKQLKLQLYRHTQAVPDIFMKEWGTNIFCFLSTKFYKKYLYILMLPKIQGPSNEVSLLHPTLIQMHIFSFAIAGLPSDIKFKFLLLTATKITSEEKYFSYTVLRNKHFHDM